jgi:hypothetical protein
MKLIRNFLLAAAMAIMIGCSSNQNTNKGEISMESWCKKDEDMPWSGCWREIGQIDCETGEEFEPDEKIGELRLKPEGNYSITWHPFETYTDYAGTYTIDEANGTITFDHPDAPKYDFDGFYSMRSNGDLELADLWFGSFYKDLEPGAVKASCGYVFRAK